MPSGSVVLLRGYQILPYQAYITITYYQGGAALGFAKMRQDLQNCSRHDAVFIMEWSDMIITAVDFCSISLGHQHGRTSLDRSTKYRNRTKPKRRST